MRIIHLKKEFTLCVLTLAYQTVYPTNRYIDYFPIQANIL